ncbi:MAG: hypothetical protein J6P98_02745, partial [Clostridia bacterium]|nr:hypothetical protein [Clostridia bacterium]
MNKLFHSGYFKEIFRQLRVAGLVSAGVLMLNNATSAFSIVFGLLDDFTSIPGGMQLALPLMEYAYIMGLVLTFIAFGWMNKRSAADFYHCIPITRKQIYFSSVAAILLWMFIGMTAYAIVHALIYLVCGAPFNYLLYLGVYLTMLIGAVEVVGATAIACSISGTRFVNLIAAVVILFIPRFLLTVMSGFVMIKDSTIVSAFITPLFDPNYNVIATPYSIFTSDLLKVSVTFGNPLAMLWNLVYALILIVLGAVAFQKRKSEMAGVPTGRGFQAVIRTAVGVPLLLVLDLIVIGRDSSRIFDFGSAADLVLPMVVLLILSFVFYSLYELISTKSAKKMVKAMPLFVICLAIGALYLVLPGLICKAENSIKLDASNIKSYSVYSEQGDGLLESLL